MGNTIGSLEFTNTSEGHRTEAEQLSRRKTVVIDTHYVPGAFLAGQFQFGSSLPVQ
jgi:hypothetical protein